MSEPENEQSEPKKKRSWLRRTLIGLALIVAVFGGAITYLFMFPEKPPLTAGTSIRCEAVAGCSRDCAEKCPDGVRKLPCMTNCTKRCAKRGCDGAAAPYKDMMLCVRSNCLMKCIGGPGPECDACAETECADERAACFQQVCPQE